MSAQGRDAGSGHHRPQLRACGVLSAADLARDRHGSKSRRHNRPPAPWHCQGDFSVTLEDETGTLNLIVTPAPFQQHRLLLRRAKPRAGCRCFVEG
jgi:hypothetical protein